MKWIFKCEILTSLVILLPPAGFAIRFATPASFSQHSREVLQDCTEAANREPSVRPLEASADHGDGPIQVSARIGYCRSMQRLARQQEDRYLPRRTMVSTEGTVEPAPVVSAPGPNSPDAPSDLHARRSRRLTRLQLAALIFLAWTAVGVFENVPELIKRISFYATVPWYASLAKMIEAWSWAILTPSLLIIEKRMHSKELSIVHVTCIFAILSIPFALIHTYLTAVLLYPFPEIYWNPLRNSDYAVYYNGGGWVTYCGVVALLEAVRFYNSFLVSQLQLERVKGSLLEARLNALRLHLEPHFLSNALNAISSEVEARPREARRMIASLGTLLRRSLDSKDGSEISLARELELLEEYLAIQRIRFGDRIDFKVEVEPSTHQINVPSMLLQPLVENAIRHGVEKRRSGGRIVVSGSISGDRLLLRVVDDGSGLPADWKPESSTGHGLRVTRERLLALYPECGGECFSIERCVGGGTQVTVRIPLRMTGHDRAQA